MKTWTSSICPASSKTAQELRRRPRPARSSSAAGPVHPSSSPSRSSCVWPGQTKTSQPAASSRRRSAPGPRFRRPPARARRGPCGRAGSPTTAPPGVSSTIRVADASGASAAGDAGRAVKQRVVAGGRCRRRPRSRPPGREARARSARDASQEIHGWSRCAWPACRRASWPTWRSPTAGRSPSSFR